MFTVDHFTWDGADRDALILKRWPGAVFSRVVRDGEKWRAQLPGGDLTPPLSYEAAKEVALVLSVMLMNGTIIGQGEEEVHIPNKVTH